MASSGTLTFGRDKVWVQAVGGYRDNFYWDFRWTSTKIGSGQTQINWSLVTHGRERPENVSYTHVRTKAKFVANYNGSDYIIYQTSTSDSSGELIYYTQDIQKTGSFIVQHSSNGSGSFTIKSYLDKIYEVISPTNDGCLSPTQTVNLDANYPYTACGAPTSVSISATNGYVAPETSFTISWSGATDGNSNKIKEYSIEWYSGNTLIGSTTSTSTSCSPTAPSTSKLARGSTLTCRVKTIGTVSGYDSSWKDSSNSIKINNLPGKPTVTADKTILTSFDTGTTLTVTVGTDGDSSQTKTVWYSTSPSGTKTQVTTNTITKSNGTHYFWTYDGLEYSTATSIVIQKNTKPTVSLTTSGSTLASVNSVSNASYVIKLNITKQDGNTTLGTNNTYNYYLYYGNSLNSLTNNISLGKNITAITDVRTKLAGKFESSGLYYKIGIIRNDGIENSDIAYGSTYYITKIPSIVSVKNKSYTENKVFNNSENYFGKNLYFIFEKDAGYTQCKVNTTNPYQATFNLTTNSDDTRGICEQNFPGGAHSLRITISYPDGLTYTYPNTISKIRIYSFNENTFNNLKGPSQIKVYGNSTAYIEGFSISGTGTFNWADYGFSGDSTSILNNAKFTIGYNSKYGTTQTGLVYVSSGSNDTTIYFKMLRSKMYNALPTSFSDKNLKYEGVSIKISFTNEFDDQHEVETKTFSIDYQEKPTVTNWNLYGFTTALSSKNYYLKEKTNLMLGGKFSSYNTNPKIRLQFKREGTSEWVNYIADFALEMSGTLTQDQPYVYEFANLRLLKTIEKITENYNGEFRLLIVNGNNNSLYTESNTTIAAKFRLHKEAEAKINSFNFIEATKTFNYEASVTNGVASNDNYFKTSITRIVEYRNPGAQNWTTLSNYSDSSQTIGADFPSGDAIIVRIKVVTTGYIYGENSDKTTYTSYSNEVTVYNTLPTVSYRKNKIGINTSQIDSSESDTIVYISGYQTKNKLYFVFGDKVCTLNLENGQLDGFKLDGGTW